MDAKESRAPLLRLADALSVTVGFDSSFGHADARGSAATNAESLISKADVTEKSPWMRSIEYVPLTQTESTMTTLPGATGP